MAGPMFLCLPLMFFVTATEGKSDVSVVQSPRFQQAIKGESITINCEITFTQGNLLGTRFEKDSSSQVDLCYVSAKTKHIAEQYKNRLECDIGKEDGKAINITFSNLQVNDSGAYFCIAGVKNGRLLDVTGKGTFLIVSDPNSQSNGEDNVKISCFKDPLLITMIILAVVGLLSTIVLLLWNTRNHSQHKKSTLMQVPNLVYEDMNLVRTQSTA
ncbi:Ig kappa chain V region 3368 isoform X1 [Narcine bancroftii]|uniref:Ig kappa chain V region 3368 isoform X1 n=1 Tax=Narcine bancroftii TaxID=1343680 RepID=UPI0038317C3E